MEDIRKTGQLSYRSLQKQNDEEITKQRKELDYEALVRLKYLQGMPSSSDLTYLIPRYELSTFQQRSDRDYWGQSTYDEDGFLTRTGWSNLLDIRADNQGWLSKAASGILKGVTIAATTAIGGTLGAANGFIQSIYNLITGENVPSGMWDNHTNRFLDYINKEMEFLLPNYYSRKEEEEPWYKNILTANFIFDKFVKNMGFTVGAAFAGGGVTKVINWLAKSMSATKLAGSTALAINAGQKAAQSMNATRYTKMLVGSLVAALSEGAIEAINSSNDFVRLLNQKIDTQSAERKSLLIKDYIMNGGTVDEYGMPIDNGSQTFQNLQKELQKTDDAVAAAKQVIAEKRVNVGNATYGLNIPILTLTNMITFGKHFAGGFKASRGFKRSKFRADEKLMKQAKREAKKGDKTLLNRIKKVVKEANNKKTKGLTLSEEEMNMVSLYKKHFIDTKLGKTLKIIKAPLAEGNEEMALGAASQAAMHLYEDDVDYMYKSRLGLKARPNTKTFMEALGEGIKDYYLNIDRWEEGFIGALTGLLGSPTFGRSNNNSNVTWAGRGKPVGISGGVIAEWREMKAKSRLRQERLDKATLAWRNNKMLVLEYEHLVSLMSMSENQEEYLARDKEFEYKTARSGKLIEEVMHLKRAGRLDIAETILEMADFTKEEAAEILENSKQEYISGMTQEEYSEVMNQKGLAESRIKHLELNLAAAQQSGNKEAELIYQGQLDAAKTELAGIDRTLLLHKTLMSQYMHDDGTFFTVDEVLNELKKRKNEYKKFLKKVTLAQEEIDSATGGILGDDLLDTLTWYRVMAEDWRERANAIVETNQGLLSLFIDSGVLDKIIEKGEISNEEFNNLPEELLTQLGGFFSQIKNRTETFKNIKLGVVNLRDLLKKLDGTNFAKLLALGIKDENGNVTVTGDEIVGMLINTSQMQAASNNLYASQAKKVALLVTDLLKIGNAFVKYDQLLSEYMEHPSLMEQEHKKLDKQARKEAREEKKKQKARELKGKNVGETMVITAQDSLLFDDEDQGGESDKKKTPITNKDLSPEQQYEAQVGSKILELLWRMAEMPKYGISQYAGYLQWMLMNINDLGVEINKASDIFDAIKNGLTKEVLKERIKEDYPDATDEHILTILNNAGQTINDFIDKYKDRILEEALNMVDNESYDALNDDDETGGIDSGIDDDTGKNKGDPDPDIDEGDDGTTGPSNDDDLNDDTPPGIDDDLNDDTKPPQGVDDEADDDTEDTAFSLPSLEELDKAKDAAKAKVSTLGGTYQNRPYLSLLFLNPINGMTYLEYLEKHPEAIPQGVDADAYKRYVRVITAAIDFDYVRGLDENNRLKIGDEIEFIIDESINEKAGTTVVLIKSNGHIIGSLPSALDWQATVTVRNSGGTMLVKNTDKMPLVKQLYDLVVSTHKTEGAQKITSTVETLMGGSPNWSSNNNSVLSIFGGKKIPIRVYGNNGKTFDFNLGANPLSVEWHKPGQTYVFIEDNKGRQIPILCTTAKLKDLGINSWYKQLIVLAFNEIAKGSPLPSLLLKIKRLLPFVLNLHIDKPEGKSYISIKWGEVTVDPSTGKRKHANIVNIGIGSGLISKSRLNNLFIKVIGSQPIEYGNGETGLPSISVDARRLNEPGYIENISQLLFANIMPESSHTVNDWFTFKMDGIEAPKEPEGSKTNEESKDDEESDPNKLIIEEDLSHGDNYVTIKFGGRTIEVVAEGSASMGSLVSSINEVKIIDEQGQIIQGLNLKILSAIHDFLEMSIKAETSKSLAALANDIIDELLKGNSPRSESIVDVLNQDGTIKSDLKQFPELLSCILMKELFCSSFNLLNSLPFDNNGVTTDALIALANSIKALLGDNIDLLKYMFNRNDPDLADLHRALMEYLKPDEKAKENSLAEPQSNQPTQAGNSSIELNIQQGENKTKSNGEGLGIVKHRGVSNKKEDKPKTAALKRREALAKKAAEKRGQNTPKTSMAIGDISELKASLLEKTKEFEWLSKNLPLLSTKQRLVIAERLIEMSKKDGVAWGTYVNGIMTIAQFARKGTVYHEAFHAVFDLMTFEEDRKALLDEARRLYNISGSDSVVEERLADAFREYMLKQENKSFFGKIKNFFLKLYYIVTGFNGNKLSIDIYFRRINYGKFKNQEIDSSSQEQISITKELKKIEAQMQESAKKTFRAEMEDFLSNFGVEIKDIEKYNSKTPIFDAIEKILFNDGKREFTDDVGYVIAFLMQKRPEVEKLITSAQKVREKLSLKGLLKGESTGAVHIAYDSAYRDLGKTIAYFLRELYDIKQPKKKFNDKIKQLADSIINKFFETMDPKRKVLLQAVMSLARESAVYAKINDPSQIIWTLQKPGTKKDSPIVDIAKALREHKYESDIIDIMQKYGLPIAGSASLALAGTVFRPVGNPLHDIDFEAHEKSLKWLKRMMNKEFPHNKHIRTISNTGVGVKNECQTFLAIDRAFKFGKTEVYYELQEDGTVKKKIKQYLLDEKTGEEIGFFVGSDLVLNDGIKGKFLDFFTGNSHRYKPSIKTINGKQYLIGDYRNALLAKIQWAREKDTWDYARFLKNSQVFEKAKKRARQLEELRMKLRNSKVIWGHPAIGKKTYLLNHSDILEWDQEVNEKRNKFIDQLLDKENKMDHLSLEYKKLKQLYMRDWLKHPEYVEFLAREWKALIERGEKENKRVFASSLPLLGLFPTTFDLVVAITSRDFVLRNMQRGGSELGSNLWKAAINKILTTIDPLKIIYTSKYFALFMDEMVNDESNALTDEQYAALIDMYKYEHLNDEVKHYMELRGISEENYESLTVKQKQTLLDCM